MISNCQLLTSTQIWSRLPHLPQHCTYSAQCQHSHILTPLSHLRCVVVWPGEEPGCRTSLVQAETTRPWQIKSAGLVGKKIILIVIFVRTLLPSAGQFHLHHINVHYEAGWEGPLCSTRPAQPYSHVLGDFAGGLPPTPVGHC